MSTSSTDDPIIYFHGMPGAPRELNLFPDVFATSWSAWNRGDLLSTLALSERFDMLAQSVRGMAEGRHARLAAFSLGAYVALEVASRLPDLKLTIDLISPAAPLQTGAYLEHMAGRTVFVVAADHPFLFKALVRVQSAGAQFAAEWLASALFQTAQGADRALRDNPQFRAAMKSVLRDCLIGGLSNYRQEIEGYVRDWSPLLQTVHHPVTLWHGLADNWTPPAMSKTLAEKPPNVTDVHLLPELSHYSTLQHALHRISNTVTR